MPIILWLIFRILTSLFIALFSPLRPLTNIERMISVWPPSAPITSWLERVWIAPWLRWDVVWYEKIVSQGYRGDDGTAAFHPLYPWLASILHWLGMNPLLSLWIVSSIACLILLIFYEKLAKLDLSPADIRFSIMLFLVASPGLILFAPYTEPLFLLWSVFCLFWARKSTWWLAGLAGALAVLTRQQGLFLLVPLAWELWQASEYKIRIAFDHWRDWLSLILIPTGMVGWLAYRGFALRDFKIDTSSINNLIYSLLISHSASQVVTEMGFIPPWQALWIAFKKIFTSPDVDIWVNLFLGFFYLVLLIIAWKHMRMSYRLYSLLIFLVSFSDYTGPVHPYMGLPRHIYIAFPIFIGAAAAIKRPWVRLIIIMLSLAGSFFLLLLYTLEAWVP